jgi:hypothetical protein
MSEEIMNFIVLPTEETVARMILHSPAGKSMELPTDMTHDAAELLGSRGQYGKASVYVTNMVELRQPRLFTIVPVSFFKGVRNFERDILEVANQQCSLSPAEPEDVFLLCQLASERLLPANLVIAHLPILTKTGRTDAPRLLYLTNDPVNGRHIIAMIVNDLIERLASQFLVFRSTA